VKVLITGATGFAGRWLIEELAEAGHDPIPAPPSSEVDVVEQRAVEQLVRSTAPDAIAHLAGISFGPDARRDPERALAVNAGGARNVLRAAGDRPVLVVSSAEVYGAPAPADLPLGERAPLATDQPYGRSKVALEVAVTEAARSSPGRRAVVRPFNHIGPGQRPEFVVPAVARRILDARDRGESSIVAGNVDVRRDFSDVRDVVRAYRLVLEALIAGEPSGSVRFYNVASGTSVTIRSIIETLARLAGVDIEIVVDPTLVRPGEPVEIRGDASLLERDIGWRPRVPLETSLRDVLVELEDGRTRSTSFPNRTSSAETPSEPSPHTLSR